MCKILKQITVLLLVFSMLFSAMAVSAAGDEVEYYSSSTYTNTLNYGVKALAQMENGDALVYAYNQLVYCIENSLESVLIYNNNCQITYEEFKIVMDAYLGDYTHHFWLDDRYGYRIATVDGNKYFYDYYPQYTMSGDELKAAKKAVNNKVDRLLRGINSSMNDFEKEKTIHDRLSDLITYDFGDNVHNIYGSLINGVSVCDGYAKALQYLLQCVGIQSIFVNGVGINTQGNTENHAWNIVYIDGEYYQTDLTWDDQSTTMHAYFNLNDELMGKDHTMNIPAYGLPECNATVENYFEYCGGKIDEINDETVDIIVNLLKSHRYIAELFITEDISKFLDWVSTDENMISIAQKLNYSGNFGLAFKSVGDEVCLFFKTALMLGDTNDDGLKNAYDLIHTRSRVLEQVNDCDVNNDGATDVMDIIALKKILANQ